MSAEENKALVHRFVEEFWNEGKTTIVDELWYPTPRSTCPWRRRLIEVDQLGVKSSVQQAEA
jgi:hypothetical protein